MKRNFITGIAMIVAAFFVGTEIAQAADVSFSGSIRTRYENETGYKGANMVVNNSPYDLTATQVRLNVKGSINPNASAFLQLQSKHTWGNNSSYTVSDGDASVGLHQAYFTLKNFAGTGVNAKVGRQEVVLDGHRLFGHTGWTTGAQTHDAVRLTHGHGNGTINYIYAMGVEQTQTSGQDLDIATHVLHTNHQGVLGGALSTYLVFTDDECGVDTNACTSSEQNQWYTLGARQAGKMFGLDYRAEYYFQTGAAQGAAKKISSGNTSSYYGTDATQRGFGPESSREAYMFGVRVGKAFKNVTWKPKITLWYDYLSGTTDEDMAEGTWGSFDTHFDTGHKFYGFMDLFLNNAGAATKYLGLQDIAIKIVLKPAAKWTLKADIHNFHTANSVGGNPDMGYRTGLLTIDTSNVAAGERIAGSGAGGRAGGQEIGSEVDLTLVHAYSPGVKLSFGYSQFMAETLWHRLKGTSVGSGYDNQARWAYVQARVAF